MCDHSRFLLRFFEKEDRVRRAPSLKSSSVLEIFKFEVNIAAEVSCQRFAENGGGPYDA